MSAIEKPITTIEEIETLPVGAVLVDNTAHAWVKGREQWWSTHPYDADHLNTPLKMKSLLLVHLPA